MGKNQRFHSTSEYYLEHTSTLLSGAVESGRITAEDGGLISEFISEVSATSTISPVRRYKLAGTLVRVHDYHPDYKKCSFTDVAAAKDAIQNAVDEAGKPRFTKNTISDYIRMLKRMFVWLVENNYSSIDLKKLQKIKVPPFDHHTVTPDNILTEGEIFQIIKACTNSRDRALISVLYEGAFRIGEVANLTWGDVTFTEWNATARTAEKTGIQRFVPLITSRGALAQWKNDYPLPITPDAFVFLTATTHKPLQYQGLAKQIRVLAERAGITKHVKPHIFRHSRITHLVQQGFNESMVKKLGWGNENTDMLDVYLHLTDDDVASKLAELNGVSTPAAGDGKKTRKMKAVQCPRCAHVNSPLAAFCEQCGEPLTDAGKAGVDKIEDTITKKMMNDPVFMQELGLMMQKLAAEKGYTQQ